jgi:hypothetical protein
VTEKTEEYSPETNYFHDNIERLLIFRQSFFMLLILLSTILIIPTLLGLGKIVEAIFKTSLSGISGKILLGIFGISIFWMILAFFIPLNICVEIPTILFGLFFFFKGKLYREFQFSKKEYFLI